MPRIASFTNHFNKKAFPHSDRSTQFNLRDDDEKLPRTGNNCRTAVFNRE
jgi:hypothetical protein